MYKDITPIMIANTTVINGITYKVLFSGEYSSVEAAYKAFDNNLNTQWSNLNSGAGYVTLDIGENNAQYISKVDIYKAGVQTKSFEIYLSNNNINYTLVYSGSYDSASDNDLKECVFNPAKARFIRIRVVTTFGPIPGIKEIKIYAISNNKCLIKQGENYYSIKDNSLSQLGMPTDDTQKEQWFNNYGVDDLKEELLTPDANGIKLIDILNNQFEIRMMKAK